MTLNNRGIKDLPPVDQNIFKTILRFSYIPMFIDISRESCVPHNQGPSGCIWVYTRMSSECQPGPLGCTDFQWDTYTNEAWSTYDIKTRYKPTFCLGAYSPRYVKFGLNKYLVDIKTLSKDVWRIMTNRTKGRTRVMITVWKVKYGYWVDGLHKDSNQGHYVIH